MPSARSIAINRAPVLTLWAAVVAERVGFSRDEALTLGRALAGVNAQSKARALGLVRSPKPRGRRGEEPARGAGRADVELMGRHIRAIRTPQGTRALAGDKPADPDAARR